MGDRVARVDALRSLLGSREVFTTAELAQELGVSLRTVQRDLATLRDLGVPIEGERGRGGGTRLHHGWSLGRVHLNESEALAMLLCLAVAEKLAAPLLVGDQRAVARKINAAFAPRQTLRVSELRRRILLGQQATARVQPTYTPPADATQRVLLDCFLNLKVATISYRDRDAATSLRDIEPHYLYFNPPVWYALAWDRLRDDVRLFRLDRITHISDTGSTFKLRPRGDFTTAGEPNAASI
jgi:predicted DNA-binding transcriptional regulator YafY